MSMVCIGIADQVRYIISLLAFDTTILWGNLLSLPSICTVAASACIWPSPAVQPPRLRDRALLATLANSGYRISEISTLTLKQVVSKGTRYVLHVQGKNDEEPRRRSRRKPMHT
jgi:site-specific recombinase XerC